MPRLVECDSCGHKYRIPDHLAGETVRCKECGADIEVPGRRRLRGQDRGSSWLAENKLWLMLGAGALLLVVVLVAVLSRGGNPVPVAQDNPAQPGNGGAPSLPIANPGLPRANVGNNTPPNASGVSNPAQLPQPTGVAPQLPQPPNPNRNLANASARSNLNKAGARGGFATAQLTASEIEQLLQKRDGKSLDEVTAQPNETLVTFAKQQGQPDRVAAAIAATTPDQWDVTPDPLPDSVTFSSKPLTVPGPERSKLIVSRTLSPVVMFGEPSADFDLVNLSTMTQSKPLRMPLSGDSFAISPDGDKIATVSSSDQTNSEIGVFQTNNSRLLRTLTIEGRVSREMFEFLDKDRLVVSLASGGGRERLAVIDIGSGDKLCEPDIGDDGHFAQTQISPGGRYLLHVDQKLGLIVCDSRSGQRVGHAPLPRLHQHERNVQVQACGVSPDGQEFAALCEDIPHQHLLVWNMERGTPTLHHILESAELRNLRFGSSRPMKVEFINGGGFLIEGSVWIDRATGGIAWQDRDAQSRLNRDSARRLLPDNRLLMVETRERNYSVLRDRPNARLTVVDLGRISGQSLSRGEEPDPPVIPKTDKSQRLNLPDDNVVWNVAADPAPSRVLLKRPKILGQAISGATSDFQYAINSSRLAVIDQPRRSASSLAAGARLRGYETNSGEMLFEASVTPQTAPLDISPNGRWLATTRGAGAISLWAFDVARPSLTFVPHKAGGRISHCRFLDDGQLLVSSEESRDRHRVSLWKVPECEQVYDLELGTREVSTRQGNTTRKGAFPIRAARFSHGGRYLVIDEETAFDFWKRPPENLRVICRTLGLVSP